MAIVTRLYKSQIKYDGITLVNFFDYEIEASSWAYLHGGNPKNIRTVILHENINGRRYVLEIIDEENKSTFKSLSILGWQYYDEETKSWYYYPIRTGETLCGEDFIFPAVPNSSDTHNPDDEVIINGKETPEYLFLKERGFDILIPNSYMFYYHAGNLYEHTPSSLKYLSAPNVKLGSPIYRVEYLINDNGEPDCFVCTNIETGAHDEFSRDKENRFIKNGELLDDEDKSIENSIKGLDIELWYNVIYGKVYYTDIIPCGRNKKQIRGVIRYVKTTLDKVESACKRKKLTQE